MKERIDLDVSKGSATKAEQYNILSELITSRVTSPATEKYEKRKKPARLDFSGAKGVIHLSRDYRIIDVDQAPTSNKRGLPACSESVEPTVAYPESARPIASTAIVPASA
jgi:hypothetical protein